MKLTWADAGKRVIKYIEKVMKEGYSLPMVRLLDEAINRTDRAISYDKWKHVFIIKEIKSGVKPRRKENE